jgi:hypothetical protein
MNSAVHDLFMMQLSFGQCSCPAKYFLGTRECAVEMSFELTQCWWVCATISQVPLSFLARVMT